MLTIQADPVPICEEADGAIRVGSTRVLLELVLNAFEDGATPETIVQNYSSLRLSDVYAVISHYLNHRDEMSEYLRRREAKAEEVAGKILSTQRDLGEIRRRLLSSRGPTEDRDAPPRR
jgi:uncharacterized protein (DUF433 family)